jgi:hypothetical protein
MYHNIIPGDVYASRRELTKEQVQDRVYDFWLGYLEKLVEDEFYDVADVKEKILLDPQNPDRLKLAQMNDFLGRKYGLKAVLEVEEKVNEFLQANGWLKVDYDDDTVEESEGNLADSCADKKKEPEKMGIYLVPLKNIRQEV